MVKIKTITEQAVDVIDNLIRDNSLKIFKTTYDERWVSLVEDGKVETFQIGSVQWELFLERYNKLNWGWMRPEFLKLLTRLLINRAEEATQVSSIRIARNDGSIQIDLMNPSREVVHILDSKPGLTIGQPKDAFFIRSMKQLPLPNPSPISRKDFIKLFKKHVPKLVLGHWLLVLAFILKALDRGRGTFPLLVIKGAPGSGKTTFCRNLKALLDPSDPAELSPPKSEDDIIVATQHSYLLVYDCVFSISEDMANALCRVASGGGIAKRKLYSDHGEMVYKVHNPIIINGGLDLDDRPELHTRSVVLELEALDEYLSETQLRKIFVSDQSNLLYGLYALLADCLAILPTLTCRSIPSLSDYALMGIAIEKALKLKEGRFLEVYKSNIDNYKERKFQNNELCSAIYKKFEESENDLIEGTADELMTALFGNLYSGYTPERRGKIFTELLKKAEPLLNLKEIIVERPPRTAARKLVKIRSRAPIFQGKKDWEYL